MSYFIVFCSKNSLFVQKLMVLDLSQISFNTK
jgi:hypothetical protein